MYIVTIVPSGFLVYIVKVHSRGASLLIFPITINHILLTALHGMQTRSSDENYVCLSVRLSVKARFATKRKKVVPAFLYRMKDHLPQFCDEKNGWWGLLFYLKFWVDRPPLERNRRF